MASLRGDKQKLAIYGINSHTALTQLRFTGLDLPKYTKTYLLLVYRRDLYGRRGSKLYPVQSDLQLVSGLCVNMCNTQQNRLSISFDLLVQHHHHEKNIFFEAQFELLSAAKMKCMYCCCFPEQMFVNWWIIILPSCYPHHV